ncbi:ABC transporter substrate-binding protein [Brachybacterium alimentarium]|uniref:ABC transporter substrate-binding protein n=1 Tax=Brachybacterium alimentarium TaxID=47845 RepID=UPI0015F11FD9|nr:ABC transporter substrate-binding protein [Brachybacterium alimentarium]
MQRRHFLTLSSLSGLAVLGLAACAGTEPAEEPAGAASGEAFSFSPANYDGLTVSMEQMPVRIVADIYSAAALQAYGIEPVGVFGFGATGSGKGDLDLDALNVLGLEGELSLEKLAAAAPDLIIGVGNAEGTGWTWWEDEVRDQATEVAPFLPIRMGGTPPEMITEYRALAEALGAGVDSAANATAEEDFEAARERIRALAAEKPDLAVLAFNTTGDVIYTSTSLGVLDMLSQDGVMLVGPDAPEDSSWAEVSWESIADYPADVILQAETSLGYEENPLWLSLPAVEADQVGTWDDKRAYTYAAQTAWLNDLATVLEDAETITS